MSLIRPIVRPLVRATSWSPVGHRFEAVEDDGIITGPLVAAVFGDSISFANQITSGGSQRTHEGVGYLTNYNILSNQRMHFPIANNSGVSGDSSSVMNARKTDLAALT